MLNSIIFIPSLNTISLRNESSRK